MSFNFGIKRVILAALFQATVEAAGVASHPKITIIRPLIDLFIRIIVIHLGKFERAIER